MNSNAERELELEKAGLKEWLEKEKRIPDLEKRVAYLERAVDQLQEADVERQAEMADLRERLESLDPKGSTTAAVEQAG